MNTQKRFIISIALILTSMIFISSNLLAQQRQGPPKIPSDDQINKMVEDLTTELSFSEEQQASIHELYTDHLYTFRNCLQFLL